MKEEYTKAEKAAAVIALVAIVTSFVGFVVAVWAGVVGLKIMAGGLGILVAGSWVYKIIKEAQKEKGRKEGRKD